MQGQRLTKSSVADHRLSILVRQGSRCAICSDPCTPTDAVLDHCHKTGAVRGVLHRSCNALLGPVENNAGRFGVRNLIAWAAGLAAYLNKHKTNITGLVHPTHKTEDEKRLARNAKARKKRAVGKAVAA